MKIVIISLSFLLSTIVSVSILKRTSNKWISMLSAFIVNTLILVSAAWTLYSIDDEAKVFGFGHTGLHVLIFAIPIISWINFFLIHFQSIRKY